MEALKCCAFDTHITTLDREELKAALKAMKKYESEAQVEQLWEAIDVNGDGKVQLRELIEYLRDTAKAVAPTEDEKAANALFSRLAGGGEAISADKVSAMLEEEYGLDPGSFDVLYRGQSDELSQESFASLLGH